MKFETRLYFVLAVATLQSCSGSNFGGSAGKKTSAEQKPSFTKTETEPGEKEDTGSGEITKVTYSDTSGAIMFRGTRGINLMTMEIGIPLNPSDLDKLKTSKGQSVASVLNFL